MNQTTKCLVGALLMSYFPSYGQTDSHDLNVRIARTEVVAKQIIPPTPEAASLGRFGNTPVSLFTGIPEISIPLYVLSGNSLQVPVTLNYHANGFRPEDRASWVGLGWSLQAGGVITRSVSGYPDNQVNYFSPDSDITIPPPIDFFAHNDFLRDGVTGYHETKPDMYFYNFGGYAGKFSLRPNEVVWKKENNDLKMTGCVTCTNSYFKITDDYGNIHFFNDAEITHLSLPDDEEPEGPAFGSYTYPSSWFLSKIISADGSDEVDFDYHYTGPTAMLYQNAISNKSITHTETVTSSIPYPPKVNDESYIASPPWTSVRRKFLKSITLRREGVPIAFIRFISIPNVRLDKLSSEDRLLNQIKIFSLLNGDTSLIKQYDFSYGYFTNANEREATRLRLDSLKAVPVDGSPVSQPPYRFTYHTDYPIPPRYTTSLDHWGFYNRGSNNSLVPSIEVLPGVSVGDGANREPDLGGTTLTLLNKISYPTGGYTTYDYELNSAKGPENSLRKIGGLRIKQIKNYSFNGRVAETKTYKYTLDNGTTSGITDNHFPMYLKHTHFHQHAKVTFSVPVPEVVYDKYTVTANSIFGFGTFQGSQVGYSQVTVLRQDSSGKHSLGKTVYHFHIGNFNVYNNDISNGTLEKESVYDNTSRLLQETTYDYRYSTEETLTMANILVKEYQDNKTYYSRKPDGYGGYTYQQSFPSFVPKELVNSRNYRTRYTPQIYLLAKQNKQLVKHTIKKYDQLSDAYISTRKIYHYGNPNHNYPTLIEQEASNGKNIENYRKYAEDYNLPQNITLDDRAAGIKNLQKKNIHGVLVESIKYLQEPDGSSKRYLTGFLEAYDKISPYPVQRYRLETPVPLPSITKSTVDPAGAFIMDTHYQLLVTYKYDLAGNLILQTGDKQMPTSYIWDYNYRFPSAQVLNSDEKSIAYTSFETDNASFYGGWSLSSSGLAINRGSALTGQRSCTLSPGGYINKIGIKPVDRVVWVSYWSRNGALTVTQNTTDIVPVTHSGPAYNGWTYYEHLLPKGTLSVSLTGAGQTIDELKFYPKDAQMTTYTYLPLIGISTQVSPANRIAYYSYDGLGRLSTHKDEEGNILEHKRYHYGLGAPLSPETTLYYSEEATGYFTQNTACPAGSTPEEFQYTVPYGKYVSAVSQEDADSKAQADLRIKGQAHADANGHCIYHSAQRSGRFFKDNCSADEGLGLSYSYIVPAGKYTSSVSQADADAKAQNDVNTNGQAEANQQASCSCEGEDRKMVNGVCEKGRRVNDSRIEESPGRWKNTYHYEFSSGTKGPYYEYSSRPGLISK